MVQLMLLKIKSGSFASWSSCLRKYESKDMDEAIFRGWEFIGEAKLYYDELRTNRLGYRVKNFVDKGIEEDVFIPTFTIRS